MEVEMGEGSNVGRIFDKSDARGEERQTQTQPLPVDYTGQQHGTPACDSPYAPPALDELSKCTARATALSVSLVACCTGLGSAWSRRS